MVVISSIISDLMSHCSLCLSFMTMKYLQATTLARAYSLSFPPSFTCNKGYTVSNHVTVLFQTFGQPRRSSLHCSMSD